MKLPILLFALLSSQICFAQIPEDLLDSSAKVQGRVDELTILADNLMGSLKIEIAQRKVQFPDYKEVYAKTQDAAEKAVSAYKMSLAQIFNEAQTELNREAIALASLEAYLTKNPSEVSSTLVSMQKERNEKSNSELIKKLQSEYSFAFINLMSLNGKIDFPATHRRSPIAWTAMIVLGAWPVLPLTAVTGSVCAGAWSTFLFDGLQLAVGFEVLNHWFPRVLHIGSLQRDSLGRKLEPGFNGHFQESFKMAAQEVFKDCNTSGCVLQISSEYLNWLHLTRPLNRSLDLGEGIELNQLSLLREKLVDHKFWKLTELAANLKSQVAEFTAEKAKP